MFLKPYQIEGSSFVTDIVIRDYRTAEIFRKYGIEYCCGGRWPLETVCMTKGIDLNEMIKELEYATRTVQVHNSLPFDQWNIDFLAEYIVHVHHHYLNTALPQINDILHKFATEHIKKYPYLRVLENTFLELYTEIIPHLKQEEEIIFPYILQIAHAFENKESYASLLVRTLQKPVEDVMNYEHASLSKLIYKMRELTNDYIIPDKACVSHKVIFLKLKELDNDLVQHIHLENNILFPKAIAMEKELLKIKD
jgi:regulator of cell morphogenesis and NO signaling